MVDGNATARRRSLCVVTTAHLPNDVRVADKFVSSYLARGWTVSWLGPDPGPVTPLDERVAYHFLRANGSRWRRALRPRRLQRLARQLPPHDLVYAPDPDSAGPAMRIGRRWGAATHFDIHEDFDTASIRRWVGGRMAKPLGRAVRRWIHRNAQRATIVSSVSQGVFDAYIPPRTDGLLLTNSVPMAFADACTAARERGIVPVQHRFRLLHGKPGAERGTREVLEGLRSHEPGMAVDLVALASRSAVERAYGAADVESWTSPDAYVRLVIEPPVAHDDMPALTVGCTAGLLSYVGELASASLPNRLFEYLAAGLPVLAPRQSPECVRIVTHYRAGLIYDLDDLSTLRDAINAVADDPDAAAAMGEAGRSGFRAELAWEAQFATLLTRVEQVLPASSETADAGQRGRTR